MYGRYELNKEKGNFIFYLFSVVGVLHWIRLIIKGLFWSETLIFTDRPFLLLIEFNVSAHGHCGRAGVHLFTCPSQSLYKFRESPVAEKQHAGSDISDR